MTDNVIMGRMMSNGNSFSDAQSDAARYPEMWLYRLMRPVQDRA